MKALLLAAGKGERIRSVAGGLPKPLLPVRGKPILVHNLELLAEHGIKEVWINLHHQKKLIQKAVGPGKRFGLKIRYSFEKKLLGTSGAAKKLERELSDGTFLVLYGDNFTDCDLSALIRSHCGNTALATIAVFDRNRNPNSGIAGGRILADSKGRVRKFQESSSSRSPLVNAGIYVLEPEVLDRIPKGSSDFGRDVFQILLKNRIGICVYKMRGYCYGSDTPEAYERTLLRGEK